MPKTQSVSVKAKLFRGLADPSRLAIVEVLRAGEKTVSEVVHSTDLSQPNVSAHLSCLRGCGLISSRQVGRRVFYTLSDSRMESLLVAAENLLASISARVARCSNYQCRTSQACVSRMCIASKPISRSGLGQGESSVALVQRKPRQTALKPMTDYPGTS